jgi:hypothetical protein
MYICEHLSLQLYHTVLTRTTGVYGGPMKDQIQVYSFISFILGIELLLQGKTLIHLEKITVLDTRHCFFNVIDGIPVMYQSCQIVLKGYLKFGFYYHHINHFSYVFIVFDSTTVNFLAW